MKRDKFYYSMNFTSEILIIRFFMIEIQKNNRNLFQNIHGFTLILLIVKEREELVLAKTSRINVSPIRDGRMPDKSFLLDTAFIKYLLDQHISLTFSKTSTKVC